MSFYNHEVVNIAKSIMESDRIQKDSDRWKRNIGVGSLGAGVLGAEYLTRPDNRIPFGGPFRDRLSMAQRINFNPNAWEYGLDEDVPRTRYSEPSLARQRMSRTRLGRANAAIAGTRAGQAASNISGKLGIKRQPIPQGDFPFASGPSKLRTNTSRALGSTGTAIGNVAGAGKTKLDNALARAAKFLVRGRF